MIFYFTATGNSLYVAKQLDAAPLSIPQVIHQKDLSFTDEAIGIVSPVFGHEVPPMVKEFMRKTAFKTEYFFMILTYGRRHGGAAELADEFCGECGIKPSYINTVLMVDNFLPVFDMAEEMKLDKHVEEQIASIKADIANRRHFIQPATDEDRAAHKAFLSFSHLPPQERWKDIYRIADKCTGCGICSKVCPSGSWSICGGKAVYKDAGCQGCMACVHACPEKAIQLTIDEVNHEARYRNEHIKLSEIIESNNQGGK